MESHSSKIIGQALELSQEVISDDEITKQIEHVRGQLKMNARCSLDGCEFDRGMLSSAYRDFEEIARLLVYHANNDYDDPVGLIRDVEECIEVLMNGWVF